MFYQLNPPFKGHKIICEKLAVFQVLKMSSWYPGPPPVDDKEVQGKISSVECAAEISQKYECFENGSVKYLSSNDWSMISAEVKEGCSMKTIHGVVVQVVPEGHFLFGKNQKGLYATKAMKEFDIVGEYCGEVSVDKASGEYLAAIDAKRFDKCGIDAERIGNETRYINSYLNIASQPNLLMRTCVFDNTPHVMLVCIKNIAIGDELLLDYGAAYNAVFLGTST